MGRADRIVVRRLTHRHGPNFSVGFRFLPPAKRRAVYSAYAVCRVADDIVDEVPPGGSVDEARRSLDAWQAEVEASYAGRPDHPATRALVEVLELYPVPVDAFLGLIEGCRWDLVKTRYANFKELERYCELVAVTISEISLAIFGPVDERARGHGRSLAMALQLTNICRDVGEDTERDRVYLPVDELAEHGVEIDGLYARVPSPEFGRFMARQVERTREYYRGANPLPAEVETDSRLAVRLMGTIYARILDAIGRSPERVLRERVCIGQVGRLGVVLSGLLRRPFVPPVGAS